MICVLAMMHVAHAATPAQDNIREGCRERGGIPVIGNGYVQCCTPHRCITCFDDGLCIMECRTALCCEAFGTCSIIEDTNDYVIVDENTGGFDLGDFVVEVNTDAVLVDNNLVLGDLGVELNTDMVLLDVAAPDAPTSAIEETEILFVEMPSVVEIEMEQEAVEPSDALCELTGGEVQLDDDGTWSCCDDHFCTVCDETAGCAVQCRSIECCLQQGGCTLSIDTDIPNVESGLEMEEAFESDDVDLEEQLIEEESDEQLQPASDETPTNTGPRQRRGRTTASGRAQRSR